MGFRALCLTENLHLRRTLRRSLQGAGSTVEFVPSAASLAERLAAAAGPGPRADEPDLIVLDPKSRREVDMAGLRGLERTQIMVVGESIDRADVVSLLRERPLNHLFSDPFAGPTASEEETLVVTSGKVFRRDIFGIEKYLAWGARVHERRVPSYDAKREALLEIAAYASDVGARRQLVARVESVTDELLMNALYDAPAIRHGVEHREAQRTSAASHRDVESPAVLRYGSDGRTLAVSVRDDYGELHKEAILDHLVRARAMRGSPQEKPTGGAGLGLYFVITSVTRFIANIAPGRMTEVIGLFDLRATGRDQEGCARSMHVFMAK